MLHKYFLQIVEIDQVGKISKVLAISNTNLKGGSHIFKNFV